MPSVGGVVMSNSERGINRRRYRRLALALPVRVSTIDAETDPYTGRPFFRLSREWCGNVSRGGVFIRTPEPLAPGRRVLVEVSLPDGTPLEATGRVAWARRVLAPPGNHEEAGVGIEFLGATTAGLAALEQLLTTGEHEGRPRPPDA
jgi:uncharacterized protein (TIGR02266 family)